ncbi:MAG: hypothetical protein WBN81_14020 [Gammaproteobacteria bacterium]
MLQLAYITAISPQGRPLPRFASPADAAPGILVLVTLGMAGMDDGIPPLVLAGGIDEGTLPADAALGNEDGRLEGLAVETDDGIPLPIDEVDTPTDRGLLLPDGGKLLKLGNLPAVLLLAAAFI